MQSASNKMNKSIHSIDQLSSSLSIDTLKEIVRNCLRNEQRLHELKRHTRHERKKAERLLHETYRIKQEHDLQMSISKLKQPSMEYFISFDDDDNIKNIDHRRNQSSIDNKTQRVRFNIPEKDPHIQIKQKKSTTTNDELDNLTRRCEDLLSHLNTHCNQTKILENSFDYSFKNNESTSLQQSLERFRPDFISHSRQRVQHINQLREEREHQQIFPSFDSNPIIHRNIQIPLTYQEMKYKSKKIYEQLPEVNDRL